MVMIDPPPPSAAAKAGGLPAANVPSYALENELRCVLYHDLLIQVRFPGNRQLIETNNAVLPEQC